MAILYVGDEKTQWIMCSIKKLLELAKGKCQTANCVHTREISYEITGCCLELNGVCKAGHRFYWSSSGVQTNGSRPKSKIFDVHILLTSAIIFSGNSFTKIKLLFDFIHLAMIGRTTFYSYQRHWISPAVKKYYTGAQVWRVLLVYTVLIFINFMLG